jgi:hypothetical protein
MLMESRKRSGGPDAARRQSPAGRQRGGQQREVSARAGSRRGNEARQRPERKQAAAHGAVPAAKPPVKKVIRPAPSRAVRPGPTFSKLQLRVHKVTCEKTTRELFKKDDMSMAGIVAYGEVAGSATRKQIKAQARKAKTVELGKFGKNDEHRYDTPKIVAEHPLGPKGGDWPREFPAWLLLVEKDEDALGKVVSTAVEAVDDEVVAFVTTAASTVAAGLAAGSALGSVWPGVGTAIGAGVGALTAAALDALKKGRRDDVFRLQAVVLKVGTYPTEAGELSSSKKTLTFRDHGAIYKVVISWAVQ